MLSVAFAVLIVATNLMVVQLVAEPSSVEPDSQLAILVAGKGRSLGGLAAFEVRWPWPARLSS